MTIPKPKRPSNVVEWFKVMGIICGALLAAGSVLYWMYSTASAVALAPVRSEINAAADTADRWPSARRLVAIERAERVAADDSLKNAVSGGQRQILGELSEIHRLLVTGR